MVFEIITYSDFAHLSSLSNIWGMRAWNDSNIISGLHLGEWCCQFWAWEDKKRNTFYFLRERLVGAENPKSGVDMGLGLEIEIWESLLYGWYLRPVDGTKSSRGWGELFWRLLYPGSELKQGRERSWENDPQAIPVFRAQKNERKRLRQREKKRVRRLEKCHWCRVETVFQGWSDQFCESLGEFEKIRTET